ncbi:MAG: sodium:solute symporter [Lentisphaerae bacterium]|nr:sodium:solute symporter [Lentisphaerota bacterium]
MAVVDWLIVGGVFLLLVGALIYCQKYVKNTADFLAANRCAGRYVLCISTGIAGFAVVNSVANFELFYEAGFASIWWGMLTAPLGLILALVAWITYRLRETRAFTISQFFELRYSRRFRICAGIVAWTSGVINYGIFPAVSVRFFMFFCRLPEYFNFMGIQWETYPVLLTFAIGIGVMFAISGGQIAIMITDFMQGTFCNIAFIIFIIFIFRFITWEHIESALLTAAPGESLINPFDSSKIKDFNIWYFLIGIFAAVYGRGGWQGGMGYAASAKTPHEGKMAGILGTWRGLAQGLMIMMFPLAVIAIMKHPDFSSLAEQIKTAVAGISDPQLQKQGLVPTALSVIMPTGIMGMFAAVMFSAMLSTDDTYLHSWGSIFIQDVVMPFRQKKFTPKQHIIALRLSIVFVGVFAWVFSYLFRQTEYVFLFFAITGAVYSGAGAVIIGGLYWKRGGTIAAWVTLLAGAMIASVGIILQQTWCFKDGSGLSLWLKNNFGWQWVANNMESFPINGQWIYFIGMASCSIFYVTISLIEHHVFKKPDFNLMKMLHRGQYDVANEHIKRTEVSWLSRRLGITREFTRRDKTLYYVTIAWTLFWMACFIYFTLKHLSGEVSNSAWLTFWHFKVYVTLVLAFITTVWFLVGGIIDVFRLFKNLKEVKRDDADDGSVINGQNAGEQKIS